MPNSGDDGGIKREIDELKQIILSQGSGSTHIMSEQPKASELQPIGGLKPLSSGQQFAAPVYDDEDDSDLLVVSKAKGDGQAALNFLNAMNALQQ